MPNRIDADETSGTSAPELLLSRLGFAVYVLISVTIDLLS